MLDEQSSQAQNVFHKIALSDEALFHNMKHSFRSYARNNPEIADFLADQVWYPVKTLRPINETYKQMLLKISEGKWAFPDKRDK